MARLFRLSWRGRQVERAVRVASERAVKMTAEHILGESQHEVPLEESTLQRSGHTGVETKRWEAVGVISYDTPYAVIQHERLDFKHDPGRKAKYLEDPVRKSAADMGRIAAAVLKGAF